MLSISSPVSSLSGIGEKKAALLSKLGIFTVGDLIRHFPRAYQNRKDVKTLLEAEQLGKVCSMVVTVGSEPKVTMLKNRKTILKFSVFDHSGKCTVVFFNANFLKNVFVLGQTYRLWGKVTKNRSSCEITAPDYELASDGVVLPDLLPVYPLTQGIGQKAIRSMINSALYALGDNIPCIIPEYIIKKYSLFDSVSAFRAVHTPRSLTTVKMAEDYFVFEELLIFALCVSMSKGKNAHLPAPPLKTNKQTFALFRKALPFEPTDAQKRVINEIASDIAKDHAMHRLITGDVGSGKTLCAAAAAYICISNGYACALMAPTEILARQHYNDLRPMFESFGMKTALLVGSLSAKEKKTVKEAMQKSDVDFIIGTHALLSDGVSIDNVALTICDEQHRFGVLQRAKLSEKTGASHTLVMSATPIPRTLALALYGDLDISCVDEMPKGRVPVSTFLVNEEYRDRLNSFIEKTVGEGRQVYIVCPSVEKADDEGNESADLIDASGNVIPALKDAVSYTENLKKTLPNIEIGYIHGRMSGKDKDEIMSDFQNGKIKVLVSTTVIEVGVNVPNASLMIVENADRFGLSQLHQLRGRVGRGKHKSFCILVSDCKQQNALERLNMLCKTTDGYKIAEFDLEQRGPGDFISTSPKGERQHGQFEFKTASLCENTEMFNRAFKEADNIISNDPTLSAKEYEVLKEILSDTLERKSGAIS